MTIDTAMNRTYAQLNLQPPTHSTDQRTLGKDFERVLHVSQSASSTPVQRWRDETREQADKLKTEQTYNKRTAASYC